MLISVSMWVGLLLLPWRPWRNREVREPEGNGKGERLGDVTVLIPARNEAEVIGRTMASVAAQGANLNILLIDDCSTDGTADQARQVAGDTLRILPGKSLPEGWGGKLWALEQGRRLVDTPMTLLLDADIELDPGILRTLRTAMRKEGLAFLSLMAMPPMGTFREKLLMPAFVYFFKLLYDARLCLFLQIALPVRACQQAVLECRGGGGRVHSPGNPPARGNGRFRDDEGCGNRRL
jgi:glycosyltransferase involved in cell wall biosynthesis